jgi:hypothetical protein
MTDSYHKTYYEKNKHKLREYQRQYYHKNKAKKNITEPIKILFGNFVISFN